MTIRHARHILAEYMVRMDLTEWKIFLRWGTKEEMKDSQGQCTWSPEYTSAEIFLRRDQPDVEIPHTLVHELVHLALQGHRPHDGRYSVMYERGINRLASAILRERVTP